MPTLFDIRTLFFVGALSSLLSALTLFVMRGLHRRSEPALRWGGAGLVLSAAGMMCVALRGLIPDFLSWVGANSFGPAGMFALYEGVRRLCHARPQRAFFIGASLTVFAIQAWIGSAAADQAARLFVTASAQALAAALMVPLLVRRIGRDPTGPVVAAILLSLAFVVANSARALWIALEGVEMSDDGLLAVGPIQATVGALFVLGPMIQALLVIAWVNGRATARLESLVSTDELTGLATRRSFFAQARRTLARKRPANQVVGLLMIDLDLFKRINDRHGHPVGDRALAHCAATLRHALTPADLVGRYGGEEFCALTVRDDPAAINTLAERIRAAVASAHLEHEGIPIELSVSIGVANTTEEQEFEALLGLADRRLYRAKANGRDRVVDSDEPPSVERRGGTDRRAAARDAPSA